MVFYYRPHHSPLNFIKLLSGGFGLSGFCHFGLVSFMAFVTEPWHSRHVLFLCARAMHSLIYMPCFVIERGVWIPALMSWVSVRFGHSRSMFFFVVWACGLEFARPCALLSLWCTQFVFLSAACIHVMSCAVWHAACIFHWLRAFMLSCLVSWRVCVLFSTWLVICFAGHVLVFLFCVSTWLCLSFLCAMCSPVNLSWPHPSCFLIIGSFAPPVFPRYPSHLLPLYSPCVCSPVPELIK